MGKCPHRVDAFEDKNIHIWFGLTGDARHCTLFVCLFVDKFFGKEILCFMLWASLSLSQGVLNLGMAYSAYKPITDFICIILLYNLTSIISDNMCK